MENSSLVNDDALSKVLDIVGKRPIFVNFEHKQRDVTEVYIALFQPEVDKELIELVGSSADDLKVGKVYDIGDIDVLLFSTISFDSSDESSFQYRNDAPCFCYIPKHKILPGLETADGKFLNANYLRTRDPKLFNSPRKWNYISFNLHPSTISSGSLKCATTIGFPYADSVSGDYYRASEQSVESPLWGVWRMEHILFTHLLYLRNQEKILFVKEMLFGSNISGECVARTSLQAETVGWKRDFHRCMLGVYDMLFFKSDGFREIMSEATDHHILSVLRKESKTIIHGEFAMDIVPVIKCSGWPRPAQEFPTRTRKWPPEQIVKNIIQNGYQLVAKSPDIDPHPDKDFLLSFSPAEKQLAHALPEQAKRAYCLLKLCFKSAKEQLPTEKLKTFHLKMALFWVAEETDPKMWEENGLLWGIRSIARFLMTSLGKKCLPSYFVSTNNLIRHFSDVDLTKILEVVQQIHDNPANFIQLAIDKEWEFTRETTPEDSFQKFPQAFDELPWLHQIKCYCQAVLKAGNYPLDKILDTTSDLRYEQFVKAPESHCRNVFGPEFRITDDQLKHVEIFVQTVTQMEIDLFNVLDIELDEHIIQSTDKILPNEILAQYPCYDSEDDEKFEEHFLATVRLRLKFYGNIFHVICNQLMEFRFRQTETVKNQDALYIIKFLKELKQRRGFSEENIDDLLHFMFYFCHFTRLRHHKLSLDEQILRSMREFLQDAKHMMTVYFNPRDIFPYPVDIGNSIETVLGECFPKKEAMNKCSVT